MSDFTDLASRHFAFLSEEHGFKCKHPSGRLVTYDNGSTFVQIKLDFDAPLGLSECLIIVFGELWHDFAFLVDISSFIMSENNNNNNKNINNSNNHSEIENDNDPNDPLSAMTSAFSFSFPL